MRKKDSEKEESFQHFEIRTQGRFQVIEMDIVLWTGLLSCITEYIALIVVMIFVVDFFSYRSKKALFVASFYFFLLTIIHLVIADFVLQMFLSGALHHTRFVRSYSNILLALSIHVFFGLLILCINLGRIVPGAVSRIVSFRDQLRNQR